MSGTSCTSSFQKKSKPQIISIQGTKPSLQNAQLLVSTGIPSFDFILGGGLPVGSILLIEEDVFDIYSKLFIKFYLTEGILNGHFIHLASLNEDPLNIFNTLPGLYKETKANCQSNSSDEKLKIAWRYQDKQLIDGTHENFQPSYDITKVLDISNYSNSLSSWDGSCLQFQDNVKFSNLLYSSLLNSIKNKINELDILPTPSKLKSNLLRIAIHSLSSPLWGSEYTKFQNTGWTDITRFFTFLKALVRSSFSVAMVTIPSHLFSDPALISQLLFISDYGIKLESFHGSEKETNPLFKEYHGLFHIKKLPLINTMVQHQIDSMDWAFHLKRKSLSIQKLHLPPELSETTSRSEEDTKQRTGIMGEALPKRLEF